MLLLDSGELVNIEAAIMVTADHQMLHLPGGLTSRLTENDYDLIREMFAADASEIRSRVQARKQQEAMQAAAQQAAIKHAIGKGLVIPMGMPGNGRR